MKKAVYLILCVLFLYCTARKKAEYNISPEVSAENRTIFIERFEKGKILYKLHCTGCHGIYSKGKDSVTNFTNQQIDNYTKVALANPQNHTVLRKISPQQFDYIITFLRLRNVPEPKEKLQSKK